MRASRRLSWASLRVSVQGCTHDIEALIPASHKYEAAGSEPAGLMPDPLQWILIAEASRSQLNAEQPLLASANTWFED